MLKKLGITFWFLLYALAAQQPDFQYKVSLARVNQPGAQATSEPGDLSGAWSGTIEVNGKAQTVYLILRREADGLTATIGPNADRQAPVRDFRAREGRVEFTQGRGRFEFTLEAGRLTGGTLLPGYVRVRTLKELQSAVNRVDAMAAAELAKENL